MPYDALKKELRELRKELHATALHKGWWENAIDPKTGLYSWPTIGSKLAMIHSEISEALECVREGKLGAFRKPSPAGTPREEKPEGMVVELADALIRVLDLCEALDLDFEEALIAKAEYNKSRPHRHGGKTL